MESRPVGSAAIFFGTPFPIQVEPGRFSKALRDCALIEGCVDNHVQLDMTDKGVLDTIEMIKHRMRHLNGPPPWHSLKQKNQYTESDMDFWETKKEW